MQKNVFNNLSQVKCLTFIRRSAELTLAATRGLSNFYLLRNKKKLTIPLEWVGTTDKRTDVWSQNFLIWESIFGLWAVAWAGLWEKEVWADSEQLFGVVFSLFRGQKKILEIF